VVASAEGARTSQVVSFDRSLDRVQDIDRIEPP